jgi:hypothetical protein
MEELCKLPIDNLRNRIGIPDSITCLLRNGLQHEIYHWLLDNSPIRINGKYEQEKMAVCDKSECEEDEKEDSNDLKEYESDATDSDD